MYVLALDQGTTSSRAVLFDHDGRIRASQSHEFKQSYPEPGWVEHDPDEIWRTQLRALRGAVAQARIGFEEIAAIGITNQRETTVVWDRGTGEPIYPAIVWQSRQTVSICDDLRARGLEEEVRSRTGLVIDAYFSATKARFILDAVEGAQGRAERGELTFGTIDSWLLWRLTGGERNGALHATDVTNASRTMLWNIHERDWDDTLLNALDLPRALLPEVRASSGGFGEIAAAHLGSEGDGAIPIAGVAGDQQAALFGQRCVEAGQAKNTYGTGCFLLMHSGREARSSDSAGVTTAPWRGCASTSTRPTPPASSTEWPATTPERWGRVARAGLKPAPTMRTIPL